MYLAEEEVEESKAVRRVPHDLLYDLLHDLLHDLRFGAENEPSVMEGWMFGTENAKRAAIGCPLCGT